MRREVEPRTREIEEKKTRCDARDPRERRAGRPAGPHDVRGVRGSAQQDQLGLISRARAVSDLFRGQLRRARRHRHDAAGSFGTPEQKRHYLPSLPARAHRAYALTEPGSGSDRAGRQGARRASADGKSWKLTGTSSTSPTRAFADLFTVFPKSTAKSSPRSWSSAARPAWRSARGAQARDPRQLDLPAVSGGLPDPGRERAGHDRRRHKIAFNILNIGRWKLGVGAVGGAKLLPGDRRQVRRASASSSASPSPISISSARRSATSRRRPSSPSRWRSAPPACWTRAAARSIPPTRRRPENRSTPSKSTPSRPRSSRSSARKMLYTTADETLQISAAPATSRTTPSNG